MWCWLVEVEMDTGLVESSLAFKTSSCPRLHLSFERRTQRNFIRDPLHANAR